MIIEKEELMKIIGENKRIVIVGYPKCGKTEISGLITDREVIHSDDFIKEVNWKDTPDFLIKLLNSKEIYAIEGIQCFRLLRTGIRNSSYFPDIVIYVNPRYPAYPNHIATRKMLDTIWNEYLAMNPKCTISFI